MDSKRSRAALAALLSLCFSCATPKSLRVTDGTYQPKGGVYGAFGSATFDETSVRGARINMSERADGSWAGNIADTTVDVSVSPGVITGALLKLSIEQAQDGYTITGLLDQTVIHFEVKADHFLVRTQNHGFRLPARGRGLFGPLGEVRFAGLAARADPPTPQTAFALIAAFLDDIGQGEHAPGPQQYLPGQGDPRWIEVPKGWSH